MSFLCCGLPPLPITNTRLPACSSGWTFSRRPSFALTETLTAGEHLDVAVGFGSDGNYYNDSTGLSMQIATAPDAPSPTLPIWRNLGPFPEVSPTAIMLLMSLAFLVGVGRFKGKS